MRRAKSEISEPQMCGMYCRQCGQVEQAWNPRLKKIAPVRHGEGVRDFLCSDCIARGFMRRERQEREAARLEKEAQSVKVDG